MFSTTKVDVPAHNVVVLKYAMSDSVLYYKYEAECSCGWFHASTSMFQLGDYIKKHLYFKCVGFAVIEE